MKIVNRNEITNETYREILDVETHHDHILYEDVHGTLRWKEDPLVRAMVAEIGLNDVYRICHELGLDKNSELFRKLYRDIGYSLNGYWEIFYWEMNNEIADEYVPNQK